MASSHCTNPNAPLTAERAMMDQIRSKLERAKRHLARQSSGSSGTTQSSSSSSRYQSSHRVTSRAPATSGVDTSRYPSTLKSRASSRRPTSSTSPSSTYQSSKYDPITSSSSRYAAQYQSRSKCWPSKFVDTDPFNGGPPPMSTPYLVYSSSRVPMSHPEARPATETHHGKPRYRQPPSSTYTMMQTPPSAMRSGQSRPPNSRVRFQGHERDSEASTRESETTTRDCEMDRRQEHGHEREHARHHLEREKAANVRKARAKEVESISEATTHRRRSSTGEKPPNSAIKLSAYDEMAHAIPTSPVGRTRRSSLSSAPPKSNIKISALDNLLTRRRCSQSNLMQAATRERRCPEHQRVDTAPQFSEEQDTNRLSDDDDDGSTSAFETDDSYEYEWSDLDADSEVASGVSVLGMPGTAMPVHAHSKDEDTGALEAIKCTQEESDDDDDDDVGPLSSGFELATVKEEDEEGVQRTAKLTAKDLARHALGRPSRCANSDASSPVASGNGKEPLKTTLPVKSNPATTEPAARKASTARAPMSYTPASSAFPSAHALSRSATSSRSSRKTLPTSLPSMPGHARRARPRAPVSAKTHLPPTIGILCGLSSGSATFTMQPAHFYTITWQSGEFAFSVQRVYTKASEYEFDDSHADAQLFLRMLLDTERSTCKNFRHVHVGDVLIRVGDTYVSELGLEGTGSVLTKFFAHLMTQTPIQLTFQRMSPSDWEGGVEL